MANALTEKLEVLPEKAKEWLYSTTVALLLGTINRRLKIDLDKRKIVSLIILELAAGELELKNLINELGRRLEIDPSIAKSLATEIVVKALKPIEFGLGIDLSELEGPPKVAEEHAQPKIKEGIVSPLKYAERVAPVAPTKEEITPLPLLVVREGKTAEGEAESFGVAQDKPFVLHEEKPSFIKEMEKAPEAPRPSLEYKIPITRAPKEPERAVTARVETPSSVIPSPDASVGVRDLKGDSSAVPQNNKTRESITPLTPLETRGGKKQEKSKPRIIHYSGLRTPIDPFSGKKK